MVGNEPPMSLTERGLEVQKKTIDVRKICGDTKGVEISIKAQSREPRRPYILMDALLKPKKINSYLYSYRMERTTNQARLPVPIL